MYIRYFARTDESGLGRAAAAFCDVLVATGIPVRLVSTRVAELQLDRHGNSQSVWDRHRQLLITAMEGRFVNVVCGDPNDWVKFHTPGATNVLFLTGSNLAPESATQPELMAAVQLYAVSMVTDETIADIVERVTSYRPHVATAAELREVFGVVRPGSAA